MFRLRRLAKQPALPDQPDLSLRFKLEVTQEGRQLAAFRQQEQKEHLQRDDRTGPRRDYSEAFHSQKGKQKVQPLKKVQLLKKVPPPAPPKRKAQQGPGGRPTKKLKLK